MNETKLKNIEFKINNLMNLRTTYYSIVVVLTSGLITLFYNITPLNIILLIIGSFIDYLFIKIIMQIMQHINKLIKLSEER